MSIKTFFQKLGADIKAAVIDTPAIVAKLGRVLAAEKAVEPALKSTIEAVVADVVSFTGLASIAVTDRGLNWQDDTKAVAAAEKLITELPALLKAIEAAASGLRA
jgi:hypothetical protein